MKILSQKPVYALTYHPELGDAACLQNMWYELTPTPKLTILNADDNKFKKDLAKLHYTPKPKDVLYFGKSSKYPRYKLSASDYKRCIKLDKADCVVLGNFKQKMSDYAANTFASVILEDELYIYIIPQRAFTDSWYIREQLGKKAFCQNPSKYIKDHNLFYGANITVLFEDLAGNTMKVSMFREDTHTEDIENILLGNYTKIIFDSELDALINSSLDVLSEEDVESICDMLDSTDSSVQGVGLKMLTSFDISKTPLAVRLMLAVRPKLQMCSEWNSVGVKQVKETVGFSNFASFPDSMYYVFPSESKISDFTKEDLDLCKSILTKATNNWLEKEVTSRLNKYNTFQVIFPKVK